MEPCNHAGAGVSCGLSVWPRGGCDMTVELYGYKHSVYAWIARLALREKGCAYEWREVNPFAEDVPADYLAMHPFKRVPVLVHDGFVLYETSAITRYVD